MYKTCQIRANFPLRFLIRNICYNQEQNLCNNVKKSSEIEQNERTLGSAFILVLTTRTNVLVLKKRLSTTLGFHPFLRHFQHFLLS